MDPKLLFIKVVHSNFDKRINNFIIRYKSLFNDAKLSREFIYSMPDTKEFLYVKEWIFANDKNIEEIARKLDIGVYVDKEIVDGEELLFRFDEIKEPHIYYINENKLYIMYVKSEYNSKYLYKIKNIITSKEFNNKLKNVSYH